jgi:predicted MFS family arabinose efflux permease
MAKQERANLAFRFVLIVGIVNCFADMTYEGARAINGPFLGSLGASAAIVGMVSGSGELLGYALRSVSGYFADKTHRYWAIIFVGYSINMLAVPALALAGNWPVAAAFIIAERTGRAIRRPSVEAMISHAGESVGRGWVFGLNEALDQGGATIGPLIMALVLSRHGGYHRAFALLLVPAALCLIILTLARAMYPRPQELADRTPRPVQVRGFSKAYWTYVAAGALIGAGFADFSLIAFHFHRSAVVREETIPVFYAVAMAAGALAALLLGRLLDKVGLPAVLLTFGLSAFASPLVFLGGPPMALTGVVLWGIGVGVQDSSLKAVLAGVVPTAKRSTAFGVFDTGFGVAWFLGSTIMGLLYDHSILSVVLFSAVVQLAALPILFLANRRGTSARL